MPLERTRNLIHEAAEIGALAIDLLGGDVLLYPHLMEFLEMMYPYKLIPVTISTKSFLSNELANKLSDVSELISEVQFSIDTDDEQIASYVVGVSDYPDRIFKSIDNALKVGLRVAVKAVITPYNVFTIPRLYRKLKKHGVPTIRLAAYSRSGHHHSDDLFLNAACYTWLNNEVEKLRQEYPNDLIAIQNGQPRLEPLSQEIRKKSWKDGVRVQQDVLV